MDSLPQNTQLRSIYHTPELVRAVLSQATKLRDCGALPQQVFEEQLERISKEELRPRGLSLLVRELPSGTTRFLIKEEKNGKVLDLIECALALQEFA